MGVISCRSRETSLIPNIYELKRGRPVTAVILEQRTGDARRASPGCEKACWRYSGSKTRPLASSGDLQQHERIGNG